MWLNGILYTVQSTQSIAVGIITANFDHKTHAPSILKKDDTTFCASSNPWHNLDCSTPSFPQSSARAQEKYC